MIDSHCHLADEAFSSDVATVVDRARGAGVEQALCIVDVTNDAEQGRADRVGKLWKELRFAVGIHPHQSGHFGSDLDSVMPTVEAAFESHSKACAVGEIGLDYHYDFAPRKTQIEVFRRQILLARDRSAPIVIHTREADDDTIDAVRTEGQDAVGGVFHCFTGDTELARRVLDLGFYISFSGIVTFKRAEDLRRVAAFVPANRLLVETDSPYLAPVPHRGKRNEPAWVTRVVHVLAGVRDQTPAEVATAASRSFEDLFGRQASLCKYS